ncbi:MAG: hypothetical protein COA94_02190 [Rickettsiales bacterium]|nr:MAG: hypothetical protein COA94_02190 [Rickettsiales bacterium]
MERKDKNKRSSLAKLLVTASAVAMIAGSAGSAMAVALNVNADVPDLAVASNIGLSAPFANGDDLTLLGAFNITTANNVVIQAINVGLFTGQTFTVGTGHTVGLTAGTMDMNVILQGVGSVFNIGVRDVTENVTVNGGAFTARHLTGTGAGNGDLTVTAGTAAVQNVAGFVNVSGGVVTSAGTVGGTLSVTGDGQFDGAAGAASDVAGIVTINTTSAAMNTIKDAALAVNLEAGKLTMRHAAADVTVTGGELTMGNAATNVIVGGGKIIDFGVITGNLTFTADAEVTTAAAAGSKVTGNVTTATDGQGTIKFTANGLEVAGVIGADGAALKLVEVSGTQQLDLTQAAAVTHYAKEFNVTAVGDNIRVADGASLNGNVTGLGFVDFRGAGSTTGNLGTNAAALTKVVAGSNAVGIVNIGAGDHFVTAFESKNNGASGFTFADGANVTGKIDNTQGNANGAIIFEGKSTVTGTIGGAGGVVAFATVSVNGDAGSVVEVNDDVSATAITIKAGTFELKDTANARIITAANGITFAANGKLKITAPQAVVNTHGVAADIITGAVNQGNIEVTGSAIFGDIGVVAGNGLASLEATKGTIELVAGVGGAGAGVHVKDVKLNEVVLKLNNAAATYKLGSVELEADNKSTLEVNDNSTIIAIDTAAGLSFGEEGKVLKALNFSANAITLTLGNGVSIYAKDLTGTVVGNINTATITTQGNNTLSFVNDNANRLAAINVNGNAGEVTRLLGATFVDGNVLLGANTTLEIDSSITTDVAANGGGIIGNAGSNGTVRFINEKGDKIEVTGAVGAGANTVEGIEFAGGDVKFNSKIEVAANSGFTFTAGADGETTIEFVAATDVDNNTFTVADTADSAAKRTVILAKAVNTFGQEIAKSKDKAITFQMSNNVNVIVVTADAAGARFTSSDGKGDLNLNKADVTIKSVGTVGNTINGLTFTENATVSEATIAKTTTVVAGKVANFNESLVGETAALGDGSIANFADGFILDSKVDGAADNDGILNFAGKASINKNIGTAHRVNLINFSDDNKEVRLATDIITSRVVNIRKGTVALDQNVSMNGTINAVESTLDLGEHSLTIENGEALTFTGENTLKIKVIEVKDTIVSGSIRGTGEVVLADANTKLHFVPVDESKSRPSNGAERKFTLIENVQLANFDLDKVDITTAIPGALVYGKELDGTTLYGSQKDNAKGYLQDLVKDNSSVGIPEGMLARIEKHTAAPEGTAGYDVSGVMLDIAEHFVSDSAAAAARVTELDNRQNTTAAATAEVIQGASSAATSSVAGRVSSIARAPGASVQRNVAYANGEGVAAGDDHARFGAWFSPFYNQTTQKHVKGSAGYKSKITGLSLGFDAKANDDLSVGVALTGSTATVNHKDKKSGDKTTVKSLMFSVYGMQQITDNWYTTGVATFGTNSVKNSEKRVISATSYDTARGKFTSMSFSGEMMFGYNHVIDDITITPTFGLRYGRVNSTGYKETGSSQNLEVSMKATNSFEAIAGVKVAAGSYEMNGAMLMPEIHASINHDFAAKTKKADAKLGGSGELGYAGKQAIKTTYEVGFGVNAEYGMMEYGFGYDAQFAKKRIGHQGTMKVRVNF